ncbi:retrovirus-related pol polyprotein from transposon TNT 1-94 [Tanacetum coccineum]|uniref:Retrovirus-related pol polyprotein from transposon TNT 1-94 n=1 Tax=Tanacetum coccineum TaxID=301880 RepID=A0ABQ4Y8S8_9ASTR
MSNPSTKSSDASPVKMEALKELPKVSLVNESLKKLKFHLAKFDNVVKIRTTPNARTEGEWGFEHTKAVFNNEIILFLKSLKDIFNVFDKDLLNEIMEVQTVFDQMEAAVQHMENKENESCDKCFNLDAELLKSQNARKEIVDIAAQIPSANTIVPGMFKLDLEPLAPRITSANVVPPKKTTSHSVETQKPELKVYSRKPKNVKNVGSSKKAKIVESKNANHSEPNHTWGSNATDIPSSSSLVMTVRFGNDHIARIMGYGDYQLGNVTISRVYYVEGLGHNLFSVGQFCDADLEVAFWKNTCFIRNLEGVDLLSGSRDTNLYIISLDDMLKTSPICLLSKASKTKSWLWHRRLSHLNFACALGKSKKSSHQPKAEDTNQEKLYLLHMDLCGPMRVASINGKRYILVIVDDYSRFTWVRFLRTKDEAPEAIIKCIKNIQVRLNATVRNVRTDNGTKFVNQTLHEFYENVGISHQTSVARTPQQNDVVERRN